MKRGRPEVTQNPVSEELRPDSRLPRQHYFRIADNARSGEQIPWIVSAMTIYRQLTLRAVANFHTFIDLPWPQS
jgi:hypothetical protein